MKESNQTIHFPPSDTQFEEIININLFSKYKAFYDIQPNSKINLSNVLREKKIVSKYKGIWINGFLSKMHLEGKTEYLDFFITSVSEATMRKDRICLNLLHET